MRQLTKKEKVGVGAALVVVIFVFLASRFIFGASGNNLVQSNIDAQQLAEQQATSGEPTATTSTTIIPPAQPAQPITKPMSNTYTTADGLTITDEVVGTGAEAKAGDSVTVNYTGTFTNGQVFDSSLNPGRTPFTFTLGAGQVIAGWDEGVAGMRVGGKRKLVIPSSLAYGPNDYGPIPGGSTLNFEVELLSVGQ